VVRDSRSATAAALLALPYRARFDQAMLDGSSLTSADLSGSAFEGGSVRGSDFYDAKLDGTSWSQTSYDCDTRFPKGFDPKAAGLVNEGRGC
jgi:hypothetical protein